MKSSWADCHVTCMKTSMFQRPPQSPASGKSDLVGQFQYHCLCTICWGPDQPIGIGLVPSEWYRSSGIGIAQPDRCSLMMETERVSETLEVFIQLTWLSDHEDFIQFSCRESLKTYIKTQSQQPF